MFAIVRNSLQIRPARSHFGSPLNSVRTAGKGSSGLADAIRRRSRTEGWLTGRARPEAIRGLFIGRRVEIAQIATLGPSKSRLARLLQLLERG